MRNTTIEELCTNDLTKLDLLLKHHIRFASFPNTLYIRARVCIHIMIYYTISIILLQQLYIKFCD